MASTALAKKDQQTALALTDLADFAIMTTDPDELREAISAATNGQRIDAFDLDVIKVPSGGMTAWTVPDMFAADGSGESIEKNIEGVVLMQRSIRSWWRVGFDERAAQGIGKAPPDCSSQDGVWGVGHPDGHPDLVEETPSAAGQFAYEAYDENGNPVGPSASRAPQRYACADCPLAQFGSGKDGRGQACRQNRLLFLLREDSALPAVVKVPPSSLKPVQSFFLKLSGKAVPPWGIVISFGLKKTSGAANIEYAEIVPSPVARLDEASLARIRATVEALKPALLGAQIDADV